MSKKFEIQAQFGKSWVTVKTEPFHKDALEYITRASGTKYPFRIVRVVKTVVFEEKK